MQFFVQSPFSHGTQVLQMDSSHGTTLSAFWKALINKTPLLMAKDTMQIKMKTLIDQIRIQIENKNIQTDQDLCNHLKDNVMVRIMINLRGGKGGFGSQLKKDAMAQKKITNWDLSRNLSGRRMRDISNEKKLIDFIKRKKNEQDKVDQDLKDFKQMQKEQGANNFGYQLINNDYRDRTEKVEEQISSSVQKGIKSILSKKHKPSVIQNKELEQLESESTIPKKIKSESQENDSESPILPTIEEKETPVENHSSSTSAKSEQLNDPSQNQEIIKAEIKVEVVNQVEEKSKEQKQEESKQAVIVEKKLIAMGEKSEFAQIDLNQMKSQSDLINLGDAHLKHELTRLGLKAGGKLEEKAGRLWAIKTNPENLFNPKFMAKTK